MSIKHPEIGEQFRSMSELHGYTVEKGDTDPRGWHVVDARGQRLGRVADLIVDTQVMKVRRLLVDLDGQSRDSSRTILALDDVDLMERDKKVVARTYGLGRTDERAGAAGYETSAAGAGSTAGSAASAGTDRQTLTRAEEELRIGKREVSGGEARIGKHVETDRVSEPVTRWREEVVVERRPVSPGSTADATITNDEVRIPLREEEVVVEKRPVIKEELVVGKRIVHEEQTVEADVQREKFDIDTAVDTTEGRTRPRGKR